MKNTKQAVWMVLAVSAAFFVTLGWCKIAFWLFDGRVAQMMFALSPIAIIPIAIGLYKDATE